MQKCLGRFERVLGGLGGASGGTLNGELCRLRLRIWRLLGERGM